MGIFDGKVALVTGAGSGLGRQYALALAKEGASVVVNDLGSNRHGEGTESKAADDVVDEITDVDGVAIANYDSVADSEGAEAMVDAAYDEFGTLDIVINNAGILRDKTLVKMEEAMWDAVMAVHLKGTFLVSRHAVRRMMDAGDEGSIINTSSYAGLKGNFGQTNYGAAKAGIAGFTRSLALEGRKYGIRTNAIAPIAKTRMTDDIDMVPDEYGPEDVVPIVLWLCTDEATEVTGRVFGAHGHHYFEYNVETTPGVELDERWSLSEVGERFSEITEKASAGGGEGGDEVRDLFAMLPQVFDADAAKGWEVTIAFDVQGTGTYGVEVADGSATFVDGAPDNPDGKVTFDSAQTILDLAAGELSPEKAFMGGQISANNMSVLMKFGKVFDLAKAGEMLAGDDDGAEGSETDADSGPGPNPEAVGNKFKPSARFVEPEAIVEYAKAVDDENPRYVSEEPEIAPPLFAVRPLFEALEEALSDRQLDADLMNLVHGEQEMIFYDVLRPWDLVAPRSEIASIEEKSSGWLVDVRQYLMRDGEKVVEASSGLFVRNPEADKSKKSKKEETSEERGEPIYTEDQVVAEDQPKRYAHASGDLNPLHLDKKVAKAAGLPNVILHGLCTMAFAARAVVDGVLDGDVDSLGRIKARFAKPVFPGDELETRVWESSEGKIEFDMVNQRGDQVLSKGEVQGR